MDKVKSFGLGVKKEIERVRWPSKKNMIKYSSSVFGFCLFFAIFFYIINVVIVLVKDVLR